MEYSILEKIEKVKKALAWVKANQKSDPEGCLLLLLFCERTLDDAIDDLSGMVVGELMKAVQAEVRKLSKERG